MLVFPPAFWTSRVKPRQFPPTLLVFAPATLRTPDYPGCSDWPAHTRLSQHCSLCLRSALFCSQLPVSFTFFANIGIHVDICVTWWRGRMSQSHGIKGGAADKAFQEQCFCGREELPRSPVFSVNWEVCLWASFILVPLLALLTRGPCALTPCRL